MKTSIDLPDELLTGIREFNKEHPERTINITGVCRKSLTQALSDALESDKA